MARAQGARAQMALAYETVYGTPPVSGFRLMPFARATLGSEQPLLESELLGYGRDPLAPIKDAVTADGEVVIPIDVEALGYWLKAAFGQPTTSGTTPKTHTFQSGNWTLPSLSIETAMPEVPRFAMYSGCVLDQLSWQMQRSGLLTATARLVAQGETIAATTAAGTPTALGLQRFGHFNGTVKRNGTALGNVVSAEITYLHPDFQTRSASRARLHGFPKTISPRRSPEIHNWPVQDSCSTFLSINFSSSAFNP